MAHKTPSPEAVARSQAKLQRAQVHLVEHHLRDSWDHLNALARLIPEDDPRWDRATRVSDDLATLIDDVALLAPEVTA